MPFEPVRFAAANYLCVELGYGGTKRLIEPYSLRRTKQGFLLLYGVKRETGEVRAYRVDRIESVEVTNQPFKPSYAVELNSASPLLAPPAQGAATPVNRLGRHRSGVVHVIECGVCGRQFKRSTYDAHLRPHKDKDGLFDCPGRTGYEVDQIFS
ncbi:MAG: WYL domain-containing protein [Chloroflexi bacterium]|nr:WYL domain-containing protein [Chloroflexota bacterium]